MSSLLRPYCIYNKKIDGEVVSRLGDSLSDIDNQENEIFICGEAEKDGWTLAETFHALDPNIFPTPFGTRVYTCINAGKTGPSQKLYLEYDPYDPPKEDTYIQFVTYFKKTEHTTRLYTYQQKSGIRITIHPITDREPLGPVLYVMRQQHSYFRCERGRCIPERVDTDFNSGINKCLATCFHSTGRTDFVGEAEPALVELRRAIGKYNNHIRIVGGVVVILLLMLLVYYMTR